jgi:hypothetical protein
VRELFAIWPPANRRAIAPARVNKCIKRAAIHQIEAQPDQPFTLFIRKRSVAKDKQRGTRPGRFARQHTVNGVGQFDMVFEQALERRCRGFGLERQAQLLSIGAQQFAKTFEPDRFQAGAFGGSGQLRAKAQPQEFRRTQGALQFAGQHRFQPSRFDGFDQRACVFKRLRGKMAEAFGGFSHTFRQRFFFFTAFL